jgi:hypothetical protein
VNARGIVGRHLVVLAVAIVLAGCATGGSQTPSPGAADVRAPFGDSDANTGRRGHVTCHVDATVD